MKKVSRSMSKILLDRARRKWKQRKVADRSAQPMLENGSSRSGRIGDFIVTIRYDRSGKIIRDTWDPIPGTNAKRVTVFDSHSAWAKQYNAYQDLKK